MLIPKEDLKYAAEVVIPVVQDVYERYNTGNVTTNAPNVRHLADIQANTRRLEETASAGDPGTAKIINDMFKEPAANPLLFGAVDFDPTTSTLFVAFRGTQKGSEWLDDLEPVPARFSDVGNPVPGVHLGFLHVWRLAKESLDDALQGIPSFRNVIISGHSLGSAVASLCALELSARNGFRELKCWTIASPRTYFGRPDRFDSTITESLRVFNPVDIVTQSPPIPFVHVRGGLAIKAKLRDFHSLLKTYQPGIKAILADNRSNTIELDPNEAEAIETARTA